MNRRELLASSAVFALGRPTRAAGLTPAEDLKKVRITKITGFRHVCPRPKLVGKNARLDVHGTQTVEHCLRIATDRGLEGVGIGNTKPEVAKKVLGHTLDEYWMPGAGVSSPLERADHALYDLVGKTLNQPVWKLLGGAGPEWVQVYDG